MEAIIIAAIIVAGVVGIAWVALHFGYKAWRAGVEDERATDGDPHVVINTLRSAPLTEEQQLAVVRQLPVGAQATFY